MVGGEEVGVLSGGDVVEGVCRFRYRLIALPDVSHLSLLFQALSVLFQCNNDFFFFFFFF
jgi:hypothetical protein